MIVIAALCGVIAGILLAGVFFWAGKKWESKVEITGTPMITNELAQIKSSTPRRMAEVIKRSKEAVDEIDQLLHG